MLVKLSPMSGDYKFRVSLTMRPPREYVLERVGASFILRERGIVTGSSTPKTFEGPHDV